MADQLPSILSKQRLKLSTLIKVNFLVLWLMRYLEKWKNLHPLFPGRINMCACIWEYSLLFTARSSCEWNGVTAKTWCWLNSLKTFFKTAREGPQLRSCGQIEEKRKLTKDISVGLQGLFIRCRYCFLKCYKMEKKKNGLLRSCKTTGVH